MNYEQQQLVENMARMRAEFVGHLMSRQWNGGPYLDVHTGHWQGAERLTPEAAETFGWANALWDRLETAVSQKLGMNRSLQAMRDMTEEARQAATTAYDATYRQKLSEFGLHDEEDAQ